MSTRKLILLALACGMAILAAFTVQVLMIPKWPMATRAVRPTTARVPTAAATPTRRVRPRGRAATRPAPSAAEPDATADEPAPEQARQSSSDPSAGRAGGRRIAPWALSRPVAAPRPAVRGRRRHG